MSLLESIKADEAELAKLTGGDTPAPVDPAPKEDDEILPDDSPKDPLKVPEPEDKAKETLELTPKEPERPDNAAFAAMRRRQKDLEEKAALLERQLLEKTNPAQLIKPEDDIEPDRLVDPDAHNDWKFRQQEKKIKELESRLVGREKTLEEIEQERQISRAERDFMGFEQAFASTVPDYEAATKHMTGVIYQSYRTIHPYDTHEQIAEKTKMHILSLAGAKLREGYDNPVAELYNMARSMGYNPKPIVKEEQSPEPKGPDLSVISANKKRTVSIGNGGSRSDAAITVEQALAMPVGQFNALPAEVKARVMQSQR